MNVSSEKFFIYTFFTLVEVTIMIGLIYIE